MRVFSLVAALLLACGSSVFAQADATNSNPIVAHVYVGENTTPGKIAGFAVHENGSVSNVSGSPFTGPSRSIVVSSGYVFGTDGTNIVTYARAANGALHESSTFNGTAHNDTPTDSEVGAMTLDRSGSSLYAGEINFQGTDNGAFAELGVGKGGVVAFKANSGISADDGGWLEFSESNRFAYGDGCYFASWDLFGFYRGTNGELTSFDPGAAIPNPNSINFQCPASMAVSARGYLAVEFGDAISGSKQSIAIYRIASSGGLVLISDSIVATNFTGATLRFDPTGNFLAAAGQNGIEVFRLNSNGTLTRLGGVLDTGVAFVDVKWDSAGHVYAISDAALYVFTLHSAGLSATGAPRGIASAGWLQVLPM